MRPWSFRSKLLVSYLVLVAGIEIATVILLDRALGRDLVAALDGRLEAQARAASGWLTTAQHPDRFAHRAAALVDARVTIVDRNDMVVGDSELPPGQPKRLDESPTPPELAAARAGGIGRSSRSEMHHVAAPAINGLVVRLSVPLAAVEAARSSARRRVLLGAAVGLVLALGLGVLAARIVARPLRAMSRSAARIAEGESDIALPVTADDEFGRLARALESMSAQLRARFEALRRSEETRRKFLADAAHELRTPTSAIRGYAQTLSDGVDEATARECAEVIDRHTRRIGRLVDDMLLLADLEARVREPASGPVPLDRVAAQVARTTADRAAAAGATVTLDVAAVVVRGDRDRLEQAIENLVDNAIKHGRERGHVMVSARAVDGRVEIVVADDGPGIPPEHLPHVFERFYRADPSRSRERGGAGLGLAIVKELVESMGGTVRAEAAEPGAGARFVVTVPRA